MRPYALCCLFWLLGVAFAQANGNKKDDKKKCAPEFKKRDCGAPIIRPPEDTKDDDPDLFKDDESDDSDAEDSDDGSVDTRGLLTDDEFDDPNLNRLLGRDILDRIDDGEEPNRLIDRILSSDGLDHDIAARLEAYHELGSRLEKRDQYKWLSKQNTDIDVLLKKKDGYYKFCDGQGDLIYKTPPYAKKGVLYDSGDWKQCDNYELKKDGSKEPKRKTGKKGEGDGYINEHILERQMLQQFARQKLEGKDVPGTDEPYCTYMQRTWEMLDPQTEILVPDSTITKDPNIPPLYLVGRAWPQTKPNRHEMVVVEQNVNKAKANLFKDGVSIHADFRFKMGSLQNVEEAHEAFRTSVLVAKYLAHEDIQKIWKAQGDRVGEAWKQAEDKLEKYWKDKKKPYKRLGLDKMWLEWLPTYTDQVHAKLWKNIKKWDGVFEDVYKKGEEAVEKLNKDSNKKDKKLSKDKEDLMKDIKAARQEVARMGLKPNLFANPWKKS